MIIALQLAEDFDRRNRDGYVRPFVGDHMGFRLNSDPERLQRWTRQVNEMIPARFLRAGLRGARMFIEIPESLEDIGVGSRDAVLQVEQVRDQERMQIRRGGRTSILQRGDGFAPAGPVVFGVPAALPLVGERVKEMRPIGGKRAISGQAFQGFGRRAAGRCGC
jgi:hypothetical protein